MEKLSEISHLFLSSIRERQTGGAPRPQRQPPGSVIPGHPRPQTSIDLTPEEFAQAIGEEPLMDGQPAPEEGKPRISAVISAHLGTRQSERVRQYAQHLAATTAERVGLVEVDASDFRLSCFEPGIDHAESTSPAAQSTSAECFDARRMSEALEEMSWDVGRWLLVLPNPRVPEAKALLRRVGEWVALSTCDHDGVVACYRSLKGLSESIESGSPSRRLRPRITLALLDATDGGNAARVFKKLAGVCQQFLDWPLVDEPQVVQAAEVSEHPLLCCQPTRDKGQLGSASQWEVVANFLDRNATPPETSHAPHAMAQAPESSAQAAPATATVFPASPVAPDPAPRSEVKPTEPAMPAGPTLRQDLDDVIDLLGDHQDEPSILASILRHCAGELVECPVTPPMCPKSRIAVGRDRRLVLLAIAGQGLADLRSIGQAYRWLTENRALIAMAVPQLSIDAHQMPHLSLLVDQSDSSAELLQPMLESRHVTVQTYRTLRWGARRGLLLQAA